MLSPSDELCRIYGLDAEQFGVTRDAFLSRVYAEDRDAAREVLDNAYRTGASFELDYRIVRPDARVRTLHAVGQVVANESGRPVGLLCAAQDATEQREAEKARMFGIDLSRADASDQARLLVLAGHDIEADQVAEVVSRDIERRGVRRLVIDVMMPVLSGTELCRCLKANANTRKRPVILMSSAGGAQMWHGAPDGKLESRRRTNRFSSTNRLLLS